MHRDILIGDAQKHATSISIQKYYVSQLKRQIRKFHECIASTH